MIDVEEDASLVKTSAKIIENKGGWTFNFSSGKGNKTGNNKTATYSFLINVEDTCYWVEDRVLRIPNNRGIVKLSHRPDKEIADRVFNEEIEDIMAGIEAEKLRQ